MVFQPLSLEIPTFSNAELISKIFFSSRIFSIVRSPFSVEPESGGRPASRRKASRV